MRRHSLSFADVMHAGFGDVDPVAIAQAAGQSAGAGSAFGPYGAIIGAAVGAGTSLVEQATGSKPAAPTATATPTKLPPVTLTANPPVTLPGTLPKLAPTTTRAAGAGTIFGVEPPVLLAIGGALLLAYLTTRKRGG